ncbi:MAG TPA: glycosyltransferase family 2 protein [Isosphaeraceae bacterium]|jgi:glycosyltransferase involved in cell wall biosynthesis|nr:glycosyltransferase family 2 protein [Isosphaeraceae bacterium]
MTTADLVQGTIAALGVTASLVWCFLLAEAIRHRRMAVQLANLPADPPEGGWPSVALIFAARNEAAAVESATRSMLAQDYPHLEVIAVDDRSTDATGTILDTIAAQQAGLRVVHVQELPPGWLGKNNALQAAADAAASDWLLFTDADVVFSPSVLRRALAFAVAQGADHLTIAPEVPTEHFGERLFLSMFGLIFLLHAPPWRVEDPRSRAHIGIGAFNLMRAGAFRAIGGLNHLSLSIDDDLRLGQALKAAGYRTRVLLGFGSLQVRWHVGVLGMMRGVEKNFFAGLDFRLPMTVFSVFAILWLGAAPHIGLLVGPWWTRAICAFGLGAVALLMRNTTWQSRIGWYYAFLLPLGALICTTALVRSTWLTLRQQGVRWRDHHYRLSELQAHVRRRNAWTREVWKSTR